MNQLKIVSAFCAIAVWVTGCANPLDILGPRDKPRIASSQWDQIRVTYWVCTKIQNEEIKRTFTITDPIIISNLKSKLQSHKTDGLSIGSGSRLVFKNPNNDIWHGNFVFQDTLYLALSSDGWKSYKFTLKDNGFYNEIRSICALNEKKYHPKATSSHIKLLTNLRFEYPKL